MYIIVIMSIKKRDKNNKYENKYEFDNEHLAVSPF